MRLREFGQRSNAVGERIASVENANAYSFCRFLVPSRRVFHCWIASNGRIPTVLSGVSLIPIGNIDDFCVHAPGSGAGREVMIDADTRENSLPRE